MAHMNSGQDIGQGVRKTSIWSVAFVALLIVNFLRMMGQSMANTVIPLYAYDLGAVASLVGFASGSFSITAILVRPFAGPAFDSFSKKKLFTIFGFLLAFAGYAYAFVDTVQGIIVIRLIHGIGMGCTAPLGLALATEFLPEDKMGSGIGIYTLAMTIAQAIGPAYGIWSVDTFGYSPTFIVVGSFLLATCLVTIFFVRDTSKGKSLPPYQLKMSRAFSVKALAPTFALTFLALPYACVIAFMAIYGDLLNIAQIGLYFTVYAIASLLALTFIGKIADKYGVIRIMIPAMVLFALSFVIAARAQTLVVILVAAMVGALGNGVCTPLGQTLAFQCVPPEQRGSASNTIYMGLDIGMLIGPLVGGFIIEALAKTASSEVAAYADMWLVMIVPIAIAITVLLASRRLIKRYQAEVTAQVNAENDEQDA